MGEIFKQLFSAGGKYLGMERQKFITTGLLTLGLAATVVSVRQVQNFAPQAAGETALLSLNPSTVSVSPGQFADVYVVFNPDNKPVVGVDIIVRFDPNYLRLDSITPQTGQTTLKTFAPVNSSNVFDAARVINQANSTGLAEFGAVAFQYSPAPGTVLAPQTAVVNPLAILRFTVKPTSPTGNTTVEYYFQTTGETKDTNITKQWTPGSETRPVDVLSAPTSKTIISVSPAVTSPTPGPTSFPTPSPTPSATPAPVPTSTPTPKPTATPTPRPTATPTPKPAAGTITSQISSGADNVNEDGSYFTSSSTQLWIGNGSAASYTGLRFNSINVPKNAKITSAVVYFYTGAAPSWINVDMTMSAHSSGNSPAFSGSSRPSSRALTTAKVNHSSNVNWNANTWYSLNDLSAVVQEIVNRPDWTQNGSISLIFKGSGTTWGRKFVTSFNSNPPNAPRLEIKYTTQ